MSDLSAGAPEDVRDLLALALDVDDLVVAHRLAKELRPWFGVAKVGLELFTAVGPDVFSPLLDLGYDVFADLKLHDIPTTVGKTAHVLGALGARYVTMHAHGGTAMLREGVDQLESGSVRAGLPKAMGVAVTVLTSDRAAPPHIMPKRAMLAVEAGCGGIVCAAGDLAEARQVAPRLFRIVPGIRPEGAPRHDQARASTPAEAVAGGADLLVIGRAVTHADDPAAAAAAIAAEVAAAR